MKKVGAFWLPDSDTHFGRWLAKGGAYQGAPRRAALNCTKRRRRVIDIGAHVGTWTVPLARVFRAVEAFEPDPANLECLRANVAETPNVRVHGCALGKVRGRAGTRCLAAGNSGMVALEPGAGDVLVTPLDEYGFDDVDLVKLDVEGAEFDILVGAENTIRAWWPTIAVEDFDGAARRLLAAWGYRLAANHRDNYVMVPR